jgi:hypothetical protein
VGRSHLALIAAMTESGARLVFVFANSCLRGIGGNICLQVHLFPDSHSA